MDPLISSWYPASTMIFRFRFSLLCCRQSNAMKIIFHDTVPRSEWRLIPFFRCSIQKHDDRGIYNSIGNIFQNKRIALKMNFMKSKKQKEKRNRIGKSINVVPECVPFRNWSFTFVRCVRALVFISFYLFYLIFIIWYEQTSTEAATTRLSARR